MPEQREIAFELERFRWSEPGRLEVVGRWSGLESRRLGRPVLRFDADGRRRRLHALPGRHFVPSGQGEWTASFAYDGDPEQVRDVVLEVGRLAVDLPAPRRRRRRPGEEEVERVRGELDEERRLRKEAEATLAERDAELVSLREEADAALAEREGELEALRSQSGESEQSREQLQAQVDEAREALAAMEEDRDRLRTDLGIRDEELRIARDEAVMARNEAEARLAAERAASTEVREKLATAREETQSTIEAEAQETERLRAELEAAREETERTVGAERAETARLREELATRPAQANGGDDAGEAEVAAKRMYERIARELEHERAAARHLRRELDAVQAQTAEYRRAASSAAANGMTEDFPAAATPAGRLAASRRTEVGRAAAHHRAEAARAASAHRVPHAHRSPAVMWGSRVAALVFVAALLIMLLLIVSWVA
jgi:hypothetical protein